MRHTYAPFLVLGIGFIAIGISGRRAFIFIGIAFLCLSLAMAKKLR